MTKIIFIHPHIASYSAAFFNSLVDFGYDITVLADLHTTNSLNQYRTMDCRYQVVDLPNNKFGPFFCRPNLRNILTQIPHDIVVYLGNPRDISQIYSMTIDFIKGQKFIIWSMFHRIGGPRFYSECIYRFFGRIAALNLCYSKTGAISQVNRGVTPRKIAVLGTAIDQDNVICHSDAVLESDLLKFQDEQDIKNKKVILQVVRLSKIKKPELLIAAMQSICKERSDVVAVLIGDGELLSVMEMAVKDAGLEKNVRLLGAIYDESILSLWFKVSSLVVVPTCIGLSVHHAMSYSCTVLTDSNYAEQASEFEVIVDRYNGLTYDPWIENSMANVILGVLDDDTLQHELGSAAKNTVLNGFSMNNKVSNFQRALERLSEDKNE